MSNVIRRILKNNDGQAIAELAITLPILLLVLCAIIDFGWFFTNQLALSYCSREGARYAIVHSEGDDSQLNITNRVLAVAPDYLRDNMTVTVTFSNDNSRRAGDVIVLVEAGVSALTPVVGTFEQGQTIVLSSKCVMKVE
jgi:Flp pilus assembly protein TadG